MNLKQEIQDIFKASDSRLIEINTQLTCLQSLVGEITKQNLAKSLVEDLAKNSNATTLPSRRRYSPAEKQTIINRTKEGKPVREIAAELGISPNAISAMKGTLKKEGRL